MGRSAITAAAKSTPKRQPRGERTKASILRRAVDIASAQGLEGLTIGGLAEALGLSKSGLFAHFGSKEELQLETIAAARQLFIEEIMIPAFGAPKGMSRLWKLCDGKLSHVERRVVSGGCFFSAASFEFDSRKGPVRTRIAEVMREWIAALEHAVSAAQKAGELDGKVDPARLAFELNALTMAAYWAYQLLDDKSAFPKARITILDKLRSLATDKCPPLPRIALS